MSATILFQLNGVAVPSSKNDRGKVAGCDAGSAGVVKDVVEDPIAGIEVTMERFGLENGSVRDRMIGDIPLPIDSMDAAGETPFEVKDRLFLGYHPISI
jgi:hypothetical protein